MKKIKSFFFLFFSYTGALSLILFALLLFFLFISTSSPLMTKFFNSYSSSGLHQIQPQHYSYIAKEITGYLQGAIPSVAFSLPINGEVIQVFNQKELIHLQDIRHLFALGKNLLFPLLFFSLSSFFILLFLKKLPIFFKALTRSSFAFFTLILLLGGWVLIDFYSLFTLFHQLLFTNDLWLLNPYTDRLIQLMPLPFFIAYGKYIALGFLLILLFLSLFSYIIAKQLRQRSYQ